MPKDGERRGGGRKGAIGLIYKVPDQGPAPGGGRPLPCQNERGLRRNGKGVGASFNGSSSDLAGPFGIPVSGSFVAEFVFFDLAVEGREPDIEQAGSFRLVAAGMVQYSLYMKFFDAGQIKGG